MELFQHQLLITVSAQSTKHVDLDDFGVAKQQFFGRGLALAAHDFGVVWTQQQNDAMELLLTICRTLSRVLGDAGSAALMFDSNKPLKIPTSGQLRDGVFGQVVAAHSLVLAGLRELGDVCVVGSTVSIVCFVVGLLLARSDSDR